MLAQSQYQTAILGCKNQADWGCPMVLFCKWKIVVLLHQIGALITVSLLIVDPKGDQDCFQ
jgi:hypothetical protein